MGLQALLVQARQRLADTLDLPGNEAALEAQILLRHMLGGVSRVWLISNEGQALTGDQQARFDTLLSRRLQGEPIAYILGRREFYGLEFGITPDVLIPRPDTETLVEAALQRIPEGQPCRVLDLGTGSGAIAIAIAAHRLLAMVTAVERSPAALEVARGNAARLSAGNLRLLQSNWFSALEGEVFDVIVSNPPYIAAADPHLSQGDLRFEPASALASGCDGLDDIRLIIAQASAYLVLGGWLLLEHGYDQAPRVAALLRDAGFGEIGHAADLAGIARVTLGRRPEV
ncbi:MAG TPA: peptide chain release factor N(5)-glutamine methyltransferase [Methylophilaceae bacterium]|nr:peptide chain release factor N(5)-glutamine methyltransferase [Methylophilaceae bacterium]HQR60088.1 peptide chain release factor N(5)-glutamine methyltransferase [Methylophilaceae bacterium]